MKIIKSESDARKILELYAKELEDAPASAGHHLNFRGGLLQHLENVLEAAKEFFPKDTTLHFLALIHDIGKARVYVVMPSGYVSYIKPDVDHILNTIVMAERAGAQLTPEELNALQFHHGGWSNFKGESEDLAVKLHFCDMMACLKERG